MTHSLHRSGSRRSQQTDYVWLLYHTRGINDQNIEERYRKALEIIEDVGSENWGDVKTGIILNIPSSKIKEKLTEKSRLRGVFTSKDQVVEFLRRMKEADLGLSVIIAGVLDDVYQAVHESGLETHTVNYSLGVFGKKELLADEKTLEHTTMCGHHMVPHGFVDQMRQRVKRGEISPKEAALALAEMCPCGIFNQVRSAELLSEEVAGGQL